MKPCASWRCTGSAPPGGYSTPRTMTSFPGASLSAFESSGVAIGSRKELPASAYRPRYAPPASNVPMVSSTLARTALELAFMELPSGHVQAAIHRDDLPGDPGCPGRSHGHDPRGHLVGHASAAQRDPAPFLVLHLALLLGGQHHPLPEEVGLRRSSGNRVDANPERCQLQRPASRHVLERGLAAGIVRQPSGRLVAVSAGDVNDATLA